MLVINRNKLKEHGFEVREEEDGNITRIFPAHGSDRLARKINKALIDEGQTEVNAHIITEEVVDKVNTNRILEICR